MADGIQDAPRHAGQVVRRVLLRRNIVIDAETAQLVAAAVQAALQADTHARPAAAATPACSRCRLPAAVLTWHRLSGSFGPGDMSVNGTPCRESGTKRGRLRRERHRVRRLVEAGVPAVPSASPSRSPTRGRRHRHWCVSRELGSMAGEPFRGRPRYVRNRPWVDVDVPNRGLTCGWLPQWSVVRWLSASALSCSVILLAYLRHDGQDARSGQLGWPGCCLRPFLLPCPSSRPRNRVCRVHAACSLAGAGSADRRGGRGDVCAQEGAAAAGGADPRPAGPVAG